MVYSKDIEVVKVKRVLKKQPITAINLTDQEKARLFDRRTLYKPITPQEKQEIRGLRQEQPIKKRYYNELTYKINGKKKKTEGIYIYKELLEKKIQRLKGQAVKNENEIITDKLLQTRQSQIAKTSPKKVKARGFYFSSIKVNIIVRYKNNTPFHFPQKNTSNAVTRSGNFTEKQMLKSVLSEEDYHNFKYYYDLQKKDKKVFIFGGWKYTRMFSKTGSFNGDTTYLDFIIREFRGNDNLISDNKLQKYRKQDTTKDISI